MGANQSRSFDFYCDFAIYHGYVESIETESPSQVYNKIMDELFATLKQMQAVCIIIYEKAVEKPHLSLKCAQLVKELENEKFYENKQRVVFHVMFSAYVLNIIKTLADSYDDRKMSDYAVQRGKSIAKFIGNLYMADFYQVSRLIEIGQIVKQIETQKNKFFIETILSTVSRKMQQTTGMTMEIFVALISDNFVTNIEESNSGSDNNKMSNFGRYLNKIGYREGYNEFYNKFEDFRNLQEQKLEMELSTLFKTAVIKFKFVNIYRNIALEIYYVRPNETINYLNKLFYERIEQFRVNRDTHNHESIMRFNNFGVIIPEYYNAGLLNNEVVEYYLSELIISPVVMEIFYWVFVEVLTKYQGGNVQNFLEYLKKISFKIPKLKVALPPIEEYVQGMDTKSGKKSIKRNIHGLSAAALPDLRDFSSKCLTFKTAFLSNNLHHQGTFTCENRPSCHFASLRGIELLKRHIGNKFFTPERIEICTKMTKESLKFQIREDIGDIFEREMESYSPYFSQEIEPTRKLNNFSILLASFYSEKFFDHKIITHWLLKIDERARENKFKSQFIEIFLDFFQKASRQLKHDNNYQWQIFSNIFETFNLQDCNFNEFNHFKDIFSASNPEINSVSLKKLQMITIPNDKSALKLISRYLITSLVERKISGLTIASIISILPTHSKTDLDKNLLRNEFQNVLCIEFGHSCVGCNEADDESVGKAELFIDFIEAMCMKTLITRLGLAILLSTMGDVIYLNPKPIPNLMKYFNKKLSHFFIGANSLPTKVEKLILGLVDKMKKAYETKSENHLEANEVLKVLEDILEDSRNKKKADDKKSNLAQNLQENSGHLDENKSSLVTSASSAQTSRSSNPKVPESSSSSSSTSPINEEPESKDQEDITASLQSSTPSAVTSQVSEDQDVQSNSSPIIQQKLSPEGIKEYEDYCDYYNSLAQKSSEDDKLLFDPTFLSTIKITNKEQIIDFSKKFIERVIAGQSTVLFFVQNAQKIGAVVQNYFKLKNQKVSFQKILVDEIFANFKKEKILVKFMCELYNNCFVNKASMVAFVDKFKTQSPENLILMHTFVRTCAIRLSTQGDKEQLIQIRGIARSAKNQANYDEDLKFMAQDLANSTNSLILLLESGQNKAQVLSEAPEKLIDDLLKNVLKNPQLYVKSASKLDGKMKDLLIQKIESIIKEVPTFVIKLDQFMNLIEFIAELYNLEFLKNDFMNFTIEIFMTSSTNEICSKSIEFLFSKCGQKIENVNKHKFDIYFKFFDAVLSEEEDTVRSECFKRIKKLRTRKWKTLNVPQNFYEDFLMLFSTNDEKVENLVEILKCDEEEMDKFIQILWKIILKDQQHPSYSILCEEISKSCENFLPKLTTFLTARCITFIGFDSDFFNENIKQRLGKVMTFVAEIYNKKLVADEILEMWMDQKLTSKLPSEFVARIFSILSTCKRLEVSQNNRLKTLVKNFDDIYYRGIDAQINSIIKGLDSIKKNVT